MDKSCYSSYMILWNIYRTESPGFKKNPHSVYATNISKIMIFSERLKDRILRKYNFVNSFNVKTDFKCFKELQGTICVRKMQNVQQELVLHAFKSDNELRNELSEYPLYL